MTSSSQLDSIHAAIDKEEYKTAQQLLVEYLQSNPNSSEAEALLEQVEGHLSSSDTPDPADAQSVSANSPTASRWGNLRDRAKQAATSAGENLHKASENLQNNESVQNYRNKFSEASGSAKQNMGKAVSQARQKAEDIQVQEYASKAGKGASRAAAATSHSTNRLVILITMLYFLFILGIANLCVNGLLFTAGGFFTTLAGEVETQLAQAQGEIAEIEAKISQGTSLTPAEEAFLREFIATAGEDINTFVPPFMLDLLSGGNPLNAVFTLSRLAVVWGILGIVLSIAAIVTAIGLMRRKSWAYRGAIGVAAFHIAIVLFTVLTGFVLEPLRSLLMFISAAIVVAFFILPGLQNTLQAKPKLA